MDLENKLNHVKEFATLKNNEVNQQLLKMATKITNINARGKAIKQILEREILDYLK